MEVKMFIEFMNFLSITTEILIISVEFITKCNWQFFFCQLEESY